MSAEIPAEQRQAILDDWQVRAETVVSCTEPLYARNREGRLELRGTGVLMRDGSLYALVSAADRRSSRF